MSPFVIRRSLLLCLLSLVVLILVVVLTGNNSNYHHLRRQVSSTLCPDQITTCENGTVCIRRQKRNVFQHGKNTADHQEGSYFYACGNEARMELDDTTDDSALLLPSSTNINNNLTERLFVDSIDWKNSNNITNTIRNSNNKHRESSTNNNNTVAVTNNRTDDDDDLLLDESLRATEKLIPPEDLIAISDEDDIMSAAAAAAAAAAAEVQVAQEESVTGTDPIIQDSSLDDSNHIDGSSVSKTTHIRSTSNTNTNDSGERQSLAVYILVGAFCLVLLEIGCLRILELRVKHSYRQQQNNNDETDPFRESIRSVNSRSSSSSTAIDIYLAKAEAQVALEDDDSDDDDDDDDQTQASSCADENDDKYVQVLYPDV